MFGHFSRQRSKDEMQSLHVLVPQYMPLRPNIKGQPVFFGGEMMATLLGSFGIILRLDYVGPSQVDSLPPRLWDTQFEER